MKSIAAIALLALALLAVPAFAAEQTREGYVAAVEPICKVNKRSSDRYLKGVTALVKSDKLEKAAQNFSKAALALEKARKQLAAVPRPPADVAKLTKWLAGIKAEVAQMRTIATTLKQGDKSKASILAIRLQNNATQTNNLVIGFEFTYCNINPAQYN
jgi:hypothetical protein